MQTFVRTAMLVVTLFALAWPAQATTLIAHVNGLNTILVGAKDVRVGGRSYDVRFVDGTCAVAFGACDTAHFTFKTYDSAIAASQALLDVVLVDISSTLMFDTKPDLTAGCGEPTFCGLHTPYGLNFYTLSARAYNVPSITLDEIGSGLVLSPGSLDFSDEPTATWAVWTPVSEPSSVLLLGLSLAVVAMGKRSLAPRQGRKL